MPGSWNLPGWGQRNAPPAPVIPETPSAPEGRVEERTPTLQEQGLPPAKPQPPVQVPPQGEDGAFNPYDLPPMPGQLPRRGERERGSAPMPPFGG